MCFCPHLAVALGLAALVPSVAMPAQAPVPAPRPDGGRPITFEENTGRWDARVRFVSRGARHALFLTEDEAVFALDGPAGARSVVRTRIGSGAGSCARRGAGRIRAGDTFTAKAHYFIGNDPALWHKDVPLHGSVRYESAYPGIDVVYHGRNGELEYDFVVAPGADPDAIRLRFDGVLGLSIDAAGDLVLRTEAGELRHRRPFVFQELDGRRQEIEARWVVGAGGACRFALGDYDAARELVIDPRLVYASFLGGSGAEQDARIVVDATGAAVVTGITSSANFPLANPVQGAMGGTDVFVTKLSPAGSTFEWSTYLGGVSSENSISDAAFRPDGSVAIAGFTQSRDYPTTPNAFQTVFQATSASAFLSVIGPTGGALSYSTLYSGSKGSAQAKAVYADGQLCVVAGTADAADLPGVGPGSFQAVKDFGADGFVARFDPGSAGPASLLNATFLGRNGTETIFDIAMGPARRVYLAMATTSSNMPAPGGFQPGYGGRTDVWFGVLNPTLSALEYGSYLGGSMAEASTRFGHVPVGLSVDPAGCGYVVTSTFSADFPVTAGALDPVYSGPEDGTVTKIDPAQLGAASLGYSTFLGGAGGDGAFDVEADHLGRAHVTGYTKSAEYPLVFALQPNNSFASAADATVTVLDPTGARVLFSTTLGGTGDNDIGQSIALGRSGDVFVTGTTGTTFPVTPGAAQTQSGGGSEVFAARIDIEWATREVYGQGHPGTLGVPPLTASADPVLGTTLDVQVGNSLGAPAAGALLVGVQRAMLPTPFGGTLLVLPLFSVSIIVPANGLAVPLSIPNDPNAIGAEVDFQVIEVDPGASQGVSFSRGLALGVGIG